MSTLDISLMIPVLEVAGWGPRVETWHLPKSWRQWKLFLLPRMRNWSYLLAPVHEGGLVAGKDKETGCTRPEEREDLEGFTHSYEHSVVVIIFCLQKYPRCRLCHLFHERETIGGNTIFLCRSLLLTTICTRQNRGHAEEMFLWQTGWWKTKWMLKRDAGCRARAEVSRWYPGSVLNKLLSS